MTLSAPSLLTMILQKLRNQPPETHPGVRKYMGHGGQDTVTGEGRRFAEMLSKDPQDPKDRPAPHGWS